MFAEMFGVELAAILEASTEETNKAEDKKAEKTSLKEENKEVRENVEIKVDEREKPKVPVSLFEVSPGFVRPIPLPKPELDLLSNSLKELMPKEVIKEEIREIKETKVKVEEEKKAKPEPKVAVCPPKPAEKGPIFVEKTAQSSERDQWENNASRQEIPTIESAGEQNMRNSGNAGKGTVKSIDEQNIGNSGNIGKETIDIGKICGELLAEKDQISPESELNSINVQPKGGYKGK